MLVGIEHNECEKIVRLVQPYSDLLSLKDTITKNLIVTESVEETITAILQFSQSGKELLQRKKMKRDYLFKYLHLQGVSVLPSSDKDVLIRTIINYWQVLYGMDSPIPTNTSSQADSPFSEDKSHLDPSTSSQNMSFDDVSRLAKEFVEMFYEKLNNIILQPQQALAMAYFSQDCELSIQVTQPETSEITLENYQGADIAERKLSDLVRVNHFIFSCDSVTPVVNTGETVGVNTSGIVRRLDEGQPSVPKAVFGQEFQLKKLQLEDSWVICECKLLISVQ